MLPLSDSQWGFRVGHSTVSALLTVVDNWLKLLEKGKEICTAFFDNRKPFDSVPQCQGSKLNLFTDDVLFYQVISRQEDFIATQKDIDTAQLLLNNHPLEQVSTFKSLSFLLSSDMSWSPHISTICLKVCEVTGLLYRRFYSMSNINILIHLYISLVWPHLEYACPVWTPTDIDSLEGVQKFAFN